METNRLSIFWSFLVLIFPHSDWISGFTLKFEPVHVSLCRSFFSGITFVKKLFYSEPWLYIQQDLWIGKSNLTWFLSEHFYSADIGAIKAILGAKLSLMFLLIICVLDFSNFLFGGRRLWLKFVMYLEIFLLDQSPRKTSPSFNFSLVWFLLLRKPLILMFLSILLPKFRTRMESHRLEWDTIACFLISVQ